jgi:hypothetical protein
VGNDTGRLYFFHIPKTAGMSVWKAIEAAYDPASVCPWWLWDQLIEIPREELTGYSVFRGHFYGFLETYIERTLPKFTILRDPVERTISYYSYIRGLPEHPACEHARTLGLREFCLHSETRYLMENYQAGYLASFDTPRLPAEIAARFTAEQRRRHLLQAALEPQTNGMDPQDLLNAARNGLSRFVAVGVSDRLKDSMHVIGRALGRPLPLPAERQNVTPVRMTAEGLDREILRTIHRITAVDRELYLRAADFVRASLEENPPDL